MNSDLSSSGIYIQQTDEADPQLNESQLNYLRLLLTLRSSDPFCSAARLPCAQFDLYRNVAQKLAFVAYLTTLLVTSH